MAIATAAATRVPVRVRAWSWLTTVDHKRIGILYLVTAAFLFLVGGFEAFLIRLQLIRPDNHLVSSAMYSQLFTMHGTTMIFLAVMPLLIGFMNAVMPLMIGARDVAFPRLNALSYWMYLAGALLLNSSWFLGGAPNAGWFNYAPISTSAYNPGPGIDFYDLGLQIAGIGTLMTGINFLVTILAMRAEGMSLMRMPLFVWTTLITSLLIIFAFPPLTVNLFLLMFDRFVGTAFFNVPHGGDVVLWEQLFWTFGHPEVYILVLPAFGIISEVVATYARKPLFGYTSMVWAVEVIAFLSFIVWSHHMFPVGLGPTVNSMFVLTSMAIAVPTGIKIFNWIATMWGGRIDMTTAMLFAMSFIPTFVVGGMSGVMTALAPADMQFHDSYFVVAHLHYVLIGGTLLAVFAATYHWFPKITGRLMSERLGRWNFWLVTIGFNVAFLPQHFIGLWGMPRRVYTYGPGLGLSQWNALSTFGVFVLTLGIVALVINIVHSLRSGAPAGPDPWDGRTLEWSVPSPAPEYNFARPPRVESRDAFWEQKQARDRAGPPDPHIHMPSPTPVPALMALGLLVAAYGALLQVIPLIPAGIGVTLYGIHRAMFEVDPGITLTPAGEGPS